MAISPYRPQDGWVVRRLFFVLLVGFGGFSAYRAYIWLNAYKLTRLPEVGGHTFTAGEIAGVCVLAAVSIAAYYLIFLKQKSSDFLVEVEAELRKVSWPEYKPVGSPKAELWGSTYVVIGVVVVMAVFIYAVDFVYRLVAGFLFYR